MNSLNRKNYQNCQVCTSMNIPNVVLFKLDDSLMRLIISPDGTLVDFEECEIIEFYKNLTKNELVFVSWDEKVMEEISLIKLKLQIEIQPCIESGCLKELLKEVMSYFNSTSSLQEVVNLTNQSDLLYNLIKSNIK